MAKVERHPHDAEKYQSTFDSYGHGKGNGKSRNAVYKHHKKFLKLQSEPTVKIDTKSDAQEIDTAQNQEIPIWEPESESENSQNQDFSEWGSVSWDEEQIGEVVANTIPSPIAAMNSAASELDTEATAKMVRFVYVGLDRMLTHWGRGVMSDKEWTLKRSQSDYDALESSTVALMAHYGVHIPISPLMAWGATVGAAYVPPVLHIRKNADPTRKKRGILSRIWPFNRKKKVSAEQALVDGEALVDNA